MGCGVGGDGVETGAVLVPNPEGSGIRLRPAADAEGA